MISKNRTYLMGIAILLIMFCHNTVAVSHFAVAWGRWSAVAQCGVDIFLLLSGFGLYHSYSKNSNYVHFLQKRFSVIAPPYLFVVIPYGVLIYALGITSLTGVLSNFSLVTFFLLGDLAEWYIASICTLYVLFPFFFHIAKSNFLTAAVCISAWVLAVVFKANINLYQVHVVSELFIVRIPVFLMGIKLAMFESKADPIKVASLAKYSLLTTAISAGCCFFCIQWCSAIQMPYWIWLRILFFPLAISLVCTLSCLRPKQGGYPDRAICYLGSITLWLYLTHEKTLFLLNRYFAHLISDIHLSSLTMNILAVFGAVGISVLLSALLNFCKSLLRTKRL